MVSRFSHLINSNQSYGRPEYSTVLHICHRGGMSGCRGRRPMDDKLTREDADSHLREHASYHHYQWRHQGRDCESEYSHAHCKLVSVQINCVWQNLKLNLNTFCIQGQTVFTHRILRRIMFWEVCNMVKLLNTLTNEKLSVSELVLYRVIF